LDNSVINVELANYALELSTLTSPITGILTHEDVTTSGVNVTPLTAFTVADPGTKVFRANVSPADIDYVLIGAGATVMLDGSQTKISGTVVKIFPEKTTLQTGEAAYEVDINADTLVDSGKLDEGGTAFIETNAQNVMLVPSWTVLGGKYVWVEVEGKPTLREVLTGKTHGGETEILSGLNIGDTVVTDPKSIPERTYRML
jgi:hypothetical protein